MEVTYNIGNYIKEEDIGMIDLSKTKNGNYLEKIRQADNTIFNSQKELTKEQVSDKLVGRSQKYKYKDVNWNSVGKTLQDLTIYMRTKIEKIYTDKDFKELDIIDEIEKFKRYYTNEGMKASSIKKEDYLKKEGDNYVLKIDNSNLNNYIIKMDGNFYSSRHLNSVGITIYDEFPGELQINLESKTGKSFTSSTIPDVRLLYPFDKLDSIGGINQLNYDNADFKQINTTQKQLFLNKTQKDIINFLPKSREINLANCFFGTDKQLTLLLANLLYCLKYPTNEDGDQYDDNHDLMNVSNDIRFILNNMNNNMAENNNGDLLYNNFINMANGSEVKDNINSDNFFGKAGFSLFSKIENSNNALNVNNFPLKTESRNIINDANADVNPRNIDNFKYLYCDNNSPTKNRTIFPEGDDNRITTDLNDRRLFRFGNLPEYGDYIKGYDTVAAAALEDELINSFTTTSLLQKKFQELHNSDPLGDNIKLSQMDSSSYKDINTRIFTGDVTTINELKYNTVYNFPTYLAQINFNGSRKLQHFMLFIYTHQILDDIITYIIKKNNDDILLKESLIRTQETIKNYYYNKLIEKFELKSVVPSINTNNLILKPLDDNNPDNELYRLNPELYYYLAYGGDNVKNKLSIFLQKCDKINADGNKRENMFKIMSELLDLGKNGIPNEFKGEDFIIGNKIYYTGGFVLSNYQNERFYLSTSNYDTNTDEYSYSLITLFATIDYFRRNMFNTFTIISKFIKDMENNIKTTVSKRQVSILLNQVFRIQGYLYNGVEINGYDSNRVLAESIIYINQGTGIDITLRHQYQNICKQLVETFKNSIMIDILLKTYQNKINEDKSILKSIDFESSKNKLVLKRLVVLKYLYEKILPEYMDYCDKKMSSIGKESEDINYNTIIQNNFDNSDKIYSTDFVGSKIGRITTSVINDNKVVGVLKKIYMKDVIYNINENIRSDIINLKTVYNEIIGSEVKQALIKGFFESQEMIRRELTGEVINNIGYIGTTQLVDTVLKRPFWLDLARRLGGLLLVPINRSSLTSTEPVAFLNVIKIGYDGYFDYERSFKGFGKSRTDHVIIPDLLSTNFHSNLLNRKSLFIIDGNNIPRNIIYLTSNNNQDPINWRALPEKIIDELQTYNRYLAYGLPLGVNNSKHAKPELKMYGNSMFEKLPNLANDNLGEPGGIIGVSPIHTSNLIMINENDQIPSMLHKYIIEGRVEVYDGINDRPLRINDEDNLFLNIIPYSVPKPVKPLIAASNPPNCRYIVYNYDIQNDYREVLIRKELYTILLNNYTGRVTESFQSGVKGYKSQFEGLCKKYYIASANKKNYKQCSILLTRDQLNGKFY